MSEEIAGWHLQQRRIWVTSDERVRLQFLSTVGMWSAQCPAKADHDILVGCGLERVKATFVLNSQLHASRDIVADILDCDRNLHLGQQSGYHLIGTNQEEAAVERSSLMIIRDPSSGQWRLYTYGLDIRSEYRRAAQSILNIDFATRYALLTALSERIEPTACR